MNLEDAISLTSPADVLHTLGHWLRAERQRMMWTLDELARRSGVPAASISRLERTGLASTESLFRVAFALDRLDPMQDFLRERERLAAIPRSLEEPPRSRPILRVRMKKKGTS